MARWTRVRPQSLHFTLQTDDVLVRTPFIPGVFCVVVNGGHFIVLSGPNSTEMSCP